MELTINDRIRTRKVDFFNEFSLSLRYDSVASAFSFGYYFEPTNIDHKELACIGHYHICKVTHNGEVLLTGTMLTEEFNSSPVRELVRMAGYSLPGVFEDCNIPPDIYPLQSDGLSIYQIAKKICDRFKIDIVVDPAVLKEVNQAIETTTANESETIKEYLSKLAGQRNVVLSHDELGRLVFTKAKTKQTPIANYEASDNGTRFTSMRLSFAGQQMHSHITMQKQASSDGGNAGEFTIRNPYVINTVYRPKVLTQTSGSDISTEQAAKNALCEELKQMKLTITTDRWEIDGKIIKPNNIVSVINPDVYLYKKSNWFIEQVDYSGDNVKQVATLHCVLPEVHNKETPTYLFAGINLH